MKKIWKMRKNREAVSPVIATILMVAITVVLAAVLYVMVMGFSGPGQQTPTGSFSAATKLSSTTEKVQFGVITPDTKQIDVKIIITKNGSAWASGVMPATSSGAWTSTVFASGVTAANLAYTSLSSTAKVGSGDYLTITPVGTGTYSVSMIYGPTSNIIGAPITFEWS